MGELGKIKPGFHEGWQAHIWSLPITIYDEDQDDTFRVVSVHEDEGFLVINISKE